MPDNLDLHFTYASGREGRIDYNRLAGTLADCGFYFTILLFNLIGLVPSRTGGPKTSLPPCGETASNEKVVLAGFGRYIPEAQQQSPNEFATLTTHGKDAAYFVFECVG